MSHIIMIIKKHGTIYQEPMEEYLEHSDTYSTTNTKKDNSLNIIQKIIRDHHTSRLYLPSKNYLVKNPNQESLVLSESTSLLIRMSSKLPLNMEQLKSLHQETQKPLKILQIKMHEYIYIYIQNIHTYIYTYLINIHSAHS